MCYQFSASFLDAFLTVFELLLRSLGRQKELKKHAFQELEKERKLNKSATRRNLFSAGTESALPIHATICCHVLVYATICWHMLPYAAICWYMLALLSYAAICWPNAAICWHMLPYAVLCSICYAICYATLYAMLYVMVY